MNDTAPSDPPRAAPLALWRVAQSFLHTLHDLFGAPEDVAFRHTLTRAPYALLLSWIRCAEALLRRLLLIEAAALPKPNTRPILWPKRQHKRRTISFEHDKPEEWRVSFRSFLGPPAPRRQSVRKRPMRAQDETPHAGEDAGRPSFHATWPLAERYEALIRVFNNPFAYARRLARHLFAQPHRIRETLRTPHEAPHRIDRFDALDHAAAIAARRFDNSS